MPRRTKPSADRRAVAVAVLAALTIGLALFNLRGAASELHQAEIHHVGAEAGRAHCTGEVYGGGSYQSLRVSFLTWVKQRLPPRAVYTLAPYPGLPDGWCATLVLLPALPAGAGVHPTWTIAAGAVPPDLEARLSRHDPSVTVFAPGYVLARDGAR